MKATIAGLFVFAAAGLAQAVDYDFLSARDAMMDSDDMFEDHEFWARDAEADLEDWMDDILETRDASTEDDGAITTILWSREAKKHHKADPNWVAPKVNNSILTYTTRADFI